MSSRQPFEIVRETVFKQFRERCPDPAALRERPLVWSLRSFGREPLPVSLARLVGHGIRLVELPANRFGPDIGYDIPEVKKELSDAGVTVTGLRGLFGPANSLGSVDPAVRQFAIDYIKRNLELAVEVQADYLTILPAAAGGSGPREEYEFDRAVETLQHVEYLFEDSGIKGAITPLDAGEHSFCSSVAQAQAFIKAVGSNGIQHISADMLLLLHEESNPFTVIMDNSETLVNLSLADTNRGAFGTGILDFDLLIAALHAADFWGYLTAAPLPAGTTAAAAAEMLPDASQLDRLVLAVTTTWREREKHVRELAAAPREI